ncbi:MAG TPA: hypothetical protein VMH30_10410, partial [Verrucomicrobiae bacterium]|nr:hypothetical protein [Verrucomicrobiae bacterium]
AAGEKLLEPGGEEGVCGWGDAWQRKRSAILQSAREGMRGGSRIGEHNACRFNYGNLRQARKG